MRRFSGLWLDSFVKSLIELEHQSAVKGDPAWTKFMQKVFDAVGDKTKCYVVMRRKKPKEYSGEYLNIDAMFIANRAYVGWTSKEWDPPVLPSVVVEHENLDIRGKIRYCLWKILSIRAPLRVLICYQNRTNHIASLKTYLEKVIWKRGLMKETDGDLLIVIGDGSKEGNEWDWHEYYNIFEWRNDRLARMKIASKKIRTLRREVEGKQGR